jgi:hypothetical protein
MRRTDNETILHVARDVNTVVTGVGQYLKDPCENVEMVLAAKAVQQRIAESPGDQLSIYHGEAPFVAAILSASVDRRRKTRPQVEKPMPTSGLEGAGDYIRPQLTFYDQAISRTEELVRALQV